MVRLIIEKHREPYQTLHGKSLSLSNIPDRLVNNKKPTKPLKTNRFIMDQNCVHDTYRFQPLQTIFSIM